MFLICVKPGNLSPVHISGVGVQRPRPIRSRDLRRPKQINQRGETDRGQGLQADRRRNNKRGFERGSDMNRS